MSQIVFAILLLIAFSIFGWTVNRFVRFIGKGRAYEKAITDPGARFGDVLVFFLGQKSVAREKLSIHHLLIFWGFLVITVGTLELLIKGLWPAFSYAMVLGETLDSAFKAILDLTNLVVLAVMIYAYFRRIVVKPNLIPMNADAGLILGMISALCITHFLMHGYEMVAAPTPEGAYHPAQPISALVAGFAAGTDPGTAGTISTVNFWIHMLVVLFFLNYIPYSKHIHLLGALPNIALRNRGTKGALPRRDLNDETQWGVGYYERFSWKSILDTYACTECARCTNNCPAYATEKPLSPMHLIHDIRDESQARGDKLIQLSPGVGGVPLDEEPDEDDIKNRRALRAILDQDVPKLPKDPKEAIARLVEICEEREVVAPENLEEAAAEIEEEGCPADVELAAVLDAMERASVIPVKPTEADGKIIKGLEEAEPMVSGRIKEETLWACVTCGACEAVCPVFIEHPQKIIEMRSHLVQAAEQTPAELARMFKGMENNFNPWGIGMDQRMDWAEEKGLELPIMEEVVEEKGKAPEYLVWIGCAGSFDDRAKKISVAWVELLQRAGVDFAVLGTEETCTGDAARRAGNEFLFQTLAKENVKLFNKYGVTKILVTCPHCYHSFKNEYPAFGGRYEVLHHTQFIVQLIQEGKLKPDKTVSQALTYHDSCYLGRWNDLYTEPRAALAASCGGKAPLEMPRTGYKSFCCGAGGARMWMEEEAPRINENRTNEALATGADTIATACPFCMVMITDGVKARDKEEEVKVLDVAEVVLAALPEKKGAAKKADEAGDASEAN